MSNPGPSLKLAAKQLAALMERKQFAVCVLMNPQPYTLELVAAAVCPWMLGEAIAVQSPDVDPSRTWTVRVTHAVPTLSRFAEPRVPYADNPWVWLLQLELVP